MRMRYISLLCFRDLKPNRTKRDCINYVTLECKIHLQIDKIHVLLIEQLLLVAITTYIHWNFLQWKKGQK